MGRLERLQFELDSNEPAKVAMIEQEVEIKIILANTHSLLPRHESEARPEFEEHPFHLAENCGLEIALAVGSFQAEKIQEIRVAKDRVRRHPVVA